MLNNVTVNQLVEMRLTSMAEGFRNQITDPALANLSFEDRFGMLVEFEWSRRKSNRLKQLIQKSLLDQKNACIEGIEYHGDRNLDRGLMTRLSTCSYMNECNNIIITGASGAGKTFVGCALGMTACRKMQRVKFIKLPELLEELAIARSENYFRKALSQYQRIKLLIIDEWLLFPPTATETRDIFEIVNSRHNLSSTIFISQFAPAEWHERFGEGTLADAIMDRIVHNAHKIHIGGDNSMRKRKGLQD